ncbi:uncharacterized protein [Eucyclogobius newberryi]|uniref:uncharacterized protein n=1 Tax=Eucyclogobius newberryi TaxID=166745 RepID=UPI003B5AC71B
MADVWLPFVSSPTLLFQVSSPTLLFQVSSPTLLFQLSSPTLLFQAQNSCLDRACPDSPQTREESDEHVAVGVESDALPDCPGVVKSEIDELISESDVDEDEGDELDTCSGSSRRAGTESDADFYGRAYAEESENDLYSQFNVEGFSAESASGEGGNAAASSDPSGGKKDKLKKHECYFCEKKFKDRHSLKRHTVVHTGEKPFQCPVCAKSYSYKETLMSHMALHGWSKTPGEEASGSKASLYTCPICMKCVTTSFALRSHVLIHTGEKPYSCPVCNKTFSQKVYVRKHMRTHTGEKPFTCSECDMKFSRKSNLNRHLKVHAAQKAQ